MYFITKNKFKIVYKLSLFRSSPPEVFSKKYALQTLSKPAGEQQCWSAISTKPLHKSHPRPDVPPKIRSTPAEHPPPGEHFWETAFVCQNNFKRLKL